MLWAREEQGMDLSAGVEGTHVPASISGGARNFWCAQLSVLRLFMLGKAIPGTSAHPDAAWAVSLILTS